MPNLKPYLTRVALSSLYNTVSSFGKNKETSYDVSAAQSNSFDNVSSFHKNKETFCGGYPSQPEAGGTAQIKAGVVSLVKVKAAA